MLLYRPLHRRAQNTLCMRGAQACVEHNVHALNLTLPCKTCAAAATPMEHLQSTAARLFCRYKGVTIRHRAKTASQTAVWTRCGQTTDARKPSGVCAVMRPRARHTQCAIALSVPLQALSHQRLFASHVSVRTCRRKWVVWELVGRWRSVTRTNTTQACSCQRRKARAALHLTAHAAALTCTLCQTHICRCGERHAFSMHSSTRGCMCRMHACFVAQQHT